MQKIEHVCREYTRDSVEPVAGLLHQPCACPDDSICIRSSDHRNDIDGSPRWTDLIYFLRSATLIIVSSGGKYILKMRDGLVR